MTELETIYGIIRENRYSRSNKLIGFNGLSKLNKAILTGPSAIASNLSIGEGKNGFSKKNGELRTFQIQEEAYLL